MAASQVIRIPSDLHRRVRTLAALTGTNPGELLSRAFDEFVSQHEADFQHSFDLAQKLVMNADVSGMLEHTSEQRSERARRAAERARLGERESELNSR